MTPEQTERAFSPPPGAQRKQYQRIRYYAAAFECGAAGKPGRPAPGTTFTRLSPDYAPPGTSWLEPEDREDSKADMAYAQEAASKMRKADLRRVLESRGHRTGSCETKADLVRVAVLAYMQERWPVMVVG